MRRYRSIFAAAAIAAAVGVPAAAGDLAPALTRDHATRVPRSTEPVAAPVTAPLLSDTLLFDNGGPLDDFESPASQVDPGSALGPFVAEAADDFYLFGDVTEIIKITGIEAWFSFFNGPAATPADWSGVSVVVYGDSAGVPSGSVNNSNEHTGDVVYEAIIPMTEVVYGGPFNGECAPEQWAVSITVDIDLPAGTTYWLALAPVMEALPQISWSLSEDLTTGAPAHAMFPVIGISNFTAITGNEGSAGAPCNDLDPGSRRDLAFRLYGNYPELPCPEDINLDRQVDTDDFLAVLIGWGFCAPQCPPYCAADVNQTCFVDTDDFLAVLLAWGNCPQTPLPIRACCYTTINFGSACVDISQVECAAIGTGLWNPADQCASPGFSCPPPIRNDECTKALPLNLVTAVTVIGDTSGVDEQIIDTCNPPGLIQTNSATLWYSVEGTGEFITASLCREGTDPAWDHILAVYCGVCDVLTCAGGGDNECIIPDSDPVAFAPEVTWCTELGRTYFIAVGGAGAGQSGVFEMEVFNDGPCGGQQPPVCWCQLPAPCTPNEGEPCYTDWGGITPIEDQVNGGFASCPSPLFDTTTLNNPAGGTACGTAPTYLTPTRAACDQPFGPPVTVNDADWFRLDVPDLGGGGASMTMIFDAQFIGQVVVTTDACGPEESDLVIEQVFTNADRCQTDFFAVNWLTAGSDYLVAVTSLEDLPCDDSAYQLQVSYDAGSDSNAGCQDFDRGEFTANAITSDIAAGFKAADDFVLAQTASVDSVTWYGLFLQNFPPLFFDCTPTGTQYTITYYTDADADGCPDAVPSHGPFAVTAVVINTGEVFPQESFAIYRMTAMHPPALFNAGACYWIEIVSTDGDDCWFLWHSSTEGNNRSAQTATAGTYLCPDDVSVVDLAWCLRGGGAPVQLALPCICLP